MRSHTITVYLAGVALLTAGLAHSAEVYRWVDENGVVNFTQQKPRNVASQHLVTKAGAPTLVRGAERAQAPQAASSTADGADMSTDQQQMLEDLRAAEEARQDEVARIRAANCERSRKVLANLSARGRIRVVDENGTERMMDEDERQRRISEAQQGIVDNCSAA